MAPAPAAIYSAKLHENDYTCQGYLGTAAVWMIAESLN